MNEVEVVEAGAELLICGVDYDVPQWSNDARRDRMAGRQILEEIDAGGVAHYRCNPPLHAD